MYANLPDAFHCAAAGDSCREVGKGHGRREVCHCRVSADREELAYSDPAGEGPNLSSVARISYERQAGIVATEQRYYLCSRSLTAADFRQKARAHWGIENRRHWVLDGAFDEDRCRARTDNAAATGLPTDSVKIAAERAPTTLRPTCR